MASFITAMAKFGPIPDCPVMAAIAKTLTSVEAMNFGSTKPSWAIQQGASGPDTNRSHSLNQSKVRTVLPIALALS